MREKFEEKNAEKFYRYEWSVQILDGGFKRKFVEALKSFTIWGSSPRS